MVLNNKIYSELLSQGNYIRLSKRLIANLGLEMAVFLSFLIDKYDFYYNQNGLINGYFYFTDNDMLLFTGLKSNTISILKKEGQAQNLFSIKKLGVPAKTYYQINFDKINEFFISQKTIEEIVYERIFKEKIDRNKLDYIFLKDLTRKELRILCKKEKISYTGLDKKETLIEKILRDGKREEIDKDKLNNMNFIELRKECKKMNITYTGKDNKNSLKEKILEKNNAVSVTEKIGHKCTENFVTSDQKIWTKLKLNIITNDQEQITTTSSLDGYKFLDKNIFNLLNDVTKKNIRKNIKDLIEETFEMIYNLTSEYVNSGKGNNFNAILYKGLLGEWNFECLNYKTNKKEAAKKELDTEKKRWLSYFAGIMSDKSLKGEVESIIIDIPLDVLAKNKRKLAMMSMFEFKQCLLSLKRNC